MGLLPLVWCWVSGSFLFGLGLVFEGIGQKPAEQTLFVVFLYVVGFGLSLAIGGCGSGRVLFSPISLLSSLLLYFLVAVTEKLLDAVSF